MSYRGYEARIEFEAEDEIFVGRVKGIDDVIGFHGANVDELRAAFHEAVDDYVTLRSALGKEASKVVGH
jgi:predicted HicB family RNase H-like nuclease